MKKSLPNPVQDNNWQDLNEGETIRVHCDHWKCEDKHDAFTITKIIGGCVFNCYRCGTSGIYTVGSNPREAISRVNQLRDHRTNCQNTNSCNYTIHLPDDHIPLVTHDKAIPAQAYGWLYRYELDDEDFDAHYISYSPKLERVIVPIWQDHKLLAWQGRDINYNKNILLYNNKYLKHKPLKYYTEYNSSINNNKKLYFILNNRYKVNNNIIIVEDPISCIKVHNYYQVTTVALLNSTLHNNLIQDLQLRNYNTTYLWLDPDAEMRSLQGALRWKGMGLNVKHITTSTDPKEVEYADMTQLNE